MNDPSSQPGSFGKDVHQYQDGLHRGLALAGEDSDFFSRGRIAWTANCLRHIGFQPSSVLDFGCGPGLSAHHFLDVLGAQSITGVDISAPLIEAAKETNKDPRVRFVLASEFLPGEGMDLAYVNGVFHHIPPADRPAAMAFILRSLKPGGCFAFWENNPWSLPARMVMWRIPFDRDAKMISAGEARRMLRGVGFEIVRTDYQFIFPRALGFLRPVEKCVAAVPLGAQYQVLARKKKN